MHFELIDTLRCLAPHEDSWLVAAADEVEGRHIMRGTLGCPVCKARYPIANGIADFTDGARAPRPSRIDHAPDDALKLAAMLDLQDARGYVILLGAWTALAAALRELVPVPVLAVNPPVDVEVGDHVSAVLTSQRIPVAAGSARGVAIDAATAALAPSAITAVRAGGRIVGELAVDPGSDVTIAARDERHWAGVRRGGAPLLQLVRTPADAR